MPRYPGPASAALLDELGRYVKADPQPFVLDLAASQGLRLATVDGQRLVDWAGFYGSKLLGHNPPALRTPEASSRLALAACHKVANPDFLTPDCLGYYRLLHRLAPRCLAGPELEVYVVNSGAEAVENLMKYFLNLHAERLASRGRGPGVRRFLYFEQAYHGRTLFALNVTQVAHDPVMTRGFRGLVPGNLQVPFPALDTSRPHELNLADTTASLAIVEAALKRYGDEVVGVVVEPLQGAGGHRAAPPQFFRGLSDLAHRYDVYLGFDEVQTAGGQTGAVFAADLFDLPHPPQAVAAAKKLGNGVVYMRHPMRDRGVLDSTWGGSLVDMVRFQLEWQVVESERLLEQVPAKAAHLQAGLRDLAARHPERLTNVRGLGLYQGFSLRRQGDKDRLLEAAREREDLLLLGAGTDTVRLRPPLTVTEADIDLLLAKLDRLLTAL
jgi:L-lysine 6-transaminase